MKNMYLIIVLVITMSFLLIPLLATENSNNDLKNSSDETKKLEQNQKSDNNDLKVLDEIKVYLNNKKEIITLNSDEYILGVMAAEVLPENDSEALKAQALAIYTYAYRKHLQNSKADNDYDITDDSTLDQGYFDADARKKKWGDKISDYEKCFKEAIKEVKNQLIIYNGEPILAAYHYISAGKTETAKNVWGTDYPYLQSENSIGDLLCPNFYSEVTVSVDEFTKAMTNAGATVNTEAEKFIGVSEKSDSGTVLNIKLCGKDFTGAQVREIFNLKSAAFDIAFKNNSFVFSVSGYGHGVGMSQFGANYLAKQGSNYKEIVAAYYRGVEIVTLK